jgi:hypothetical protein
MYIVLETSGSFGPCVEFVGSKKKAIKFIETSLNHAYDTNTAYTLYKLEDPINVIARKVTRKKKELKVQLK